MDVNFHSSHVSGGAREGHVCKLVCFRGEGVSGDHGIFFRPIGTSGVDEWELSSPDTLLQGESGSAPLRFSYVIYGSGWKGDPPWSPGSQGRVCAREAVKLLAPPRLEGEGRSMFIIKPDLDIVQLRAPLDMCHRFICMDRVQLDSKHCPWGRCCLLCRT